MVIWSVEKEQLQTEKSYSYRWKNNNLGKVKNISNVYTG